MATLYDMLGTNNMKCLIGHDYHKNNPYDLVIQHRIETNDMETITINN